MAGARILVIDDEPQLRRALRLALEGHGYEVREAEEGTSGITVFQTFRPDVVLLDLMMPGLNGVEVCRVIRGESTTPIIILSVIGEEKAKVEALEEGADDYLTKPFGSAELVARI